MWSLQSRTAIACKLSTAMTLLVHSMFGCGLMHACCSDHNLIQQCPVGSKTSCSHHKIAPNNQGTRASKLTATKPTATKPSHHRGTASSHAGCQHGDHQSDQRSAAPTEIKCDALSPEVFMPGQTCCGSPAPCSQQTPGCCSKLHCSFIATSAKESGTELRRLFPAERFAQCQLLCGEPQVSDIANQHKIHSSMDAGSLCAMHCSWQI